MWPLYSAYFVKRKNDFGQHKLKQMKSTHKKLVRPPFSGMWDIFGKEISIGPWTTRDQTVRFHSLSLRGDFSPKWLRVSSSFFCKNLLFKQAVSSVFVIMSSRTTRSTTLRARNLRNRPMTRSLQRRRRSRGKWCKWKSQPKCQLFASCPGLFHVLVIILWKRHFMSKSTM